MREAQPVDTRAGCILRRLGRGEVEVGREVVVAAEERRLVEREVRAPRQLDQLVGATRVTAEDQRATAGLDADRIGLDRVVGGCGDDAERPDLGDVDVVSEVELAVHALLGRKVVGPGKTVCGPGRTEHRDRGLGAVGVVLARDVVGREVDAVVGVQVREHHAIDPVDVGVALQRTERAVAEVEHDAMAVVLHEVARGGRVGCRKTAGHTDDRESHQAMTSEACSTLTTSGPRKRRASVVNGSGSPVARNRCCGGGSDRSRSRPSATRVR